MRHTFSYSFTLFSPLKCSIEDACRYVLNGDEEALKQLALDNASYPMPKLQNTSTAS